MYLFYTSGTTGIPKGAMITNGNINWMVGTLNTFYGEQAEDVFICALLLFHANGKLQSFLAAVNTGATEVLYAHLKVNEAAVIGIPDERYGEEGMAYIVLKERMDATENEFMEYLRGKVARFKLMKYITFMDHLPKNSIGKILKRELNSNIK
jgi:acyl-CoA synthetase (AMP-forming)/AMP-acid ligase II